MTAYNNPELYNPIGFKSYNLNTSTKDTCRIYTYNINIINRYKQYEYTDKYDITACNTDITSPTTTIKYK